MEDRKALDYGLYRPESTKNRLEQERMILEQLGGTGPKQQLINLARGDHFVGDVESIKEDF